MPRLAVNDPTRTDPRSVITVERIAATTDMVSPTDRYLTSSGDAALSLVAGITFAVGAGGLFTTQQTTLGVGNLDSGSAFISGRDYYVYICNPDTANERSDEVYRISLNSTFPAGFNALNSRKIGGFHFGQCRRVNARLQPVNTSNVAFGTGWEANIFNGIVPRSVWTLQHRPKCAPEGMVFIGGNTWVDIYLSSDDGNGGLQSIQNAVPLSGTEGLHWYTFNERALVVGKRLMSYAEWCQLAAGSPEGLNNNNDNGWTMADDRMPTGTAPRATSAVGIRDAVGNLYEYTSDLFTSQNAAPPVGVWQNPMPGFGQMWLWRQNGLHVLVAGGTWGDGSIAGSRAVHVGHWPWNVFDDAGVRCACESL